MTRPGRILAALGLAAVVCLATGCKKNAPAECNDDECDPDRGCFVGCGPPCNFDGVCDPSESEYLCEDCDSSCDMGMSGSEHDVIVSELFLPTSSTEAAENGIDIDGDGDIDNKLGQIVSTLTANGFAGDLNQLLNAEIAAGRLLLLSRMRESGHSDGVVALALYFGEIYDATPVFEGEDSAIIAPYAITNLHLCGEWADPDLETSPSSISLTFRFPGHGYPTLMLDAAQIRTVDDPDSIYFGSSTVSETGWTDVMIGGGLSSDEIQHNLIPFLTLYISDRMTLDATTAEALATTFDGNCVVSEIPGCEAVVPGEGECDSSLDPPVITETEVRCNPQLNAALAPDIDYDGDGEDDLLSLGFRITGAVPVTIVE